MTRKFEIEAGKFVAVGTTEYQEMLVDYRDNMIESQDLEPGDFAWEFRHELMAGMVEHDGKRKAKEDAAAKEKEKEKEKGAEAQDAATAESSSGDAAEAKEEGEDEDEDGPDLLLPGVLEARNVQVLKRIAEFAAERTGQRIVLPWGGAHMPGIEKELLAQGYTQSAAQWRLAVKVKKLHDGVTPEDEDTPFDFYVPFALQVRKLDSAWSLSMLFHSITWEHAPDDDDAFSLLWDLAFSWGQNQRKDTVSWQILPSLFDRPLLFAYDGEGEKTNLRFLLLGNVEF